MNFMLITAVAIPQLPQAFTLNFNKRVYRDKKGLKARCRTEFLVHEAAIMSFFDYLLVFYDEIIHSFI